MDGYKTVKKAGSDEFVERKSRFIGYISPVETAKEADSFINGIKTQHWQATHNCWAYILKDGIIQRYSDDGEPQGTAGIPILEVLKKEEIFDVVVVVTRYYGGIMLGAGGLIRAYSQGAKIAIDAGERIMMALCFIVEMEMPYNIFDRFCSLTGSYPIETLTSEYGENISLTLKVRKDYFERTEHILTELSAGSVSAEIIGEKFAAI